MNKTDSVTEEQLKELKAIVRKLQPEAHMIETNFGQVKISDMLRTDRFDLDKAASSAGWVAAIENPEEEEPETEEYGISSFVYSRRRPFSRYAFQDFAGHWPRAIIRCKGMTWFKEDPNMSYIFEQAGMLMRESPGGRFLASAPKEQQKLILEKYPNVKEIWDSKYGDRMQKIVFIGRHMNREEIEAGLDRCLVD